MRILYMADRYDYSDPQRGDSFEHVNFYDALVRMGQEVTYFDPTEIAQAIGLEAMNHRLLDTVRVERPEILFTVVNELLADKAVLREITNNTDTMTVNWFCDDHWRFESFSRHWTPCFDWVVTTSEAAVPRYEALGLRNVIKSQWACNPGLYQRKPDMPMVHDVSFVGQRYGRREEIIETLHRSGIRAEAWGAGWPAGRLTTQQMIETFQQSRINLNFTEASISERGESVKRYWNRRVRPCLHRLPGGWRVDRPGRDAMLGLVQRVHAPPRQIKGRVFEVPACGGFLLTGPAENLQDYYQPDKEAVIFRDVDELVAVIRHYLRHEEDRARIAQAGYERTLKDHTYAQRFAAIFDRIGVTESSTPVTRAA